MAGNAANIKVAPMNLTFDDIDLGYLEGDIEMTTEITTKEITTHQTGDDPIASIITGTKIGLSFEMKEVSMANLKLAMSTIGEELTPTGSGATPVFGIGTSKKFANTFTLAKRLVMHPVGVADADKSKDWCFWKAFIKMDSLTFSGAEFQTIPVTVEIFEDPTKPAAVRKMLIGDWTQEAFEDEV